MVFFRSPFAFVSNFWVISTHVAIMRLINVRTLKLSEFFGDNIPQYAILTHTWEDEEVTYQEWDSWTAGKNDSIQRKAGFQKVWAACRQSEKDRFEWLWVDTNCIDKASSAELSEAINSMFAWYKNAGRCYAYMSDVPHTDASKAVDEQTFRKSRWFTRGWTLQELLAPRDLIFYSQTWIRLGSKSGSLSRAASQAASIWESFITGESPALNASDVMKMSWLSRRQTTRVEDIAYCMLGILDINMPLLYGEGHRAFTRLQEAVIASRVDHTIFCWTWDSSVPDGWTSILAPSPHVFKFSWGYTQSPSPANVAPYVVTNLGLSLSMPVLATSMGLMVQLNATNVKTPGNDYRAFIVLETTQAGNVFKRVSFPVAPIYLYSRTTQAFQSRYDFYALSKPIISHGYLGSQYTEAPEDPRYYAVFPIFDYSSSGEINQSSSSPQYILRSMHFEAVGSEQSRACNNVWTIPPCQDDEGLSNAELFSISDLSLGGSKLGCIGFVFFAVDSTRKPAVWYCEIDIKSPVGVPKLIHQYSFDGQNHDYGTYRELFEHWKKRASSWNRRHRTDDSTPGGLRLSLGTPMESSYRGEVRPVLIGSGSLWSRDWMFREEMDMADDKDSVVGVAGWNRQTYDQNT